MRFASNLIVALFMAIVMLAALLAFAMGMSDPEKKGSLAIAGAILGGSMLIAMALATNGEHDRPE